MNIILYGDNYAGDSWILRRIILPKDDLCNAFALSTIDMKLLFLGVDLLRGL